MKHEYLTHQEVLDAARVLELSSIMIKMMMEKGDIETAVEQLTICHGILASIVTLHNARKRISELPAI